jgi:hypothetical protein
MEILCFARPCCGLDERIRVSKSPRGLAAWSLLIARPSVSQFHSDLVPKQAPKRLFLAGILAKDDSPQPAKLIRIDFLHRATTSVRGERQDVFEVRFALQRVFQVHRFTWRAEIDELSRPDIATVGGRPGHAH